MEACRQLGRGEPGERPLVVPHPGVRDQRVELPKTADRLDNSIMQLIALTDVRHHCVQSIWRRTLGVHAVQLLGAMPNDRDGRSLCKVTLCHRAPDTRAASRDQRDIAAEPPTTHAGSPRKSATSRSNSACRSSCTQCPQRPKTCS
ncbi:Uncharacterised protein [Mycobacteroides abscessus subsp. abscessus]|nr:Uncharacterised protein [Mycobacteroides abscessus subsp. abscessus]